ASIEYLKLLTESFQLLRHYKLNKKKTLPSTSIFIGERCLATKGVSDVNGFH
ncbi:hypothetical protein L9F63_024037, partial [Diploptera punctata]